MAEITGYGNMLISYNGVDIPITTKEYQIKDYKQESLKFEFDNQNNIQYLYKKGNRWIRKIRVYQIAQTDAEFKALAVKLYAMNGFPVLVTPHIDEPSKTQLSWIIAFWDRYNEYPVEFIEITLTGVDVDEIYTPSLPPQAPIITIYTVGGVWSNGIVNITSPDGGTIYYEIATTNPPDPTLSSPVFTIPSGHGAQFVVKAVVYKNSLWSEIVTDSFWVG